MRVSAIAASPPHAVEQALKTLGDNIRTARLRRRLTRQVLASKIGISRHVLADVESGKTTTAVASYAGALWALGLLEGFALLADPDEDAEGKALEATRRPRTAPKRWKASDDDF